MKNNIASNMINENIECTMVSHLHVDNDVYIVYDSQNNDMFKPYTIYV